MIDLAGTISAIRYAGDKGVRPRLLDLFCGAGGAAMGYQRAGFYVVGVDNRPQPHYCGDEFHEADALTFDEIDYAFERALRHQKRRQDAAPKRR